MEREFSVIIERDSEGTYVASVPELRGCHTQAKSLDKLMSRIREAIDLSLDDEDDAVPDRPASFVGVHRLSVRA
jgi:predicted RNase H-like HicB family nuclease